MFKIGDKARVFCKRSRIHLAECEICSIGAINYTIIVDGIIWYVGKSALIPMICIYVNDIVSK